MEATRRRRSDAGSRFVLLTPVGRSALASWRLDGQGATRAVESCFEGRSRSEDPATWPVGPVRFGTWHLGGGAREEVVVVRVAPHAYELHSHGGSAVVRAVQATFEEAGCVEDDSADSAFPGVGPASRQAWRDLPGVTTPTCAAILLAQAKGALDRALDEVAAALDARDPRRAGDLVSRLIASFRLGRHVLEPFRLQLAGPANAGKSSLFNRWLGYERAITHGEPGTTRDILEAEMVCRGFPVTLMDGAGLRDSSSDRLEQEGVHRVIRQAEEADLIIWIVDGTSSMVLAELPEWVKRRPHLAVVNKADLGISSRWPAEWMRVSVRTGVGIETLWKRVEEMLVGEGLPAEGPVVWRRDQEACLRGVQRALSAGDLAQAERALRSTTP